MKKKYLARAFLAIFGLKEENVARYKNTAGLMFVAKGHCLHYLRIPFQLFKFMDYERSCCLNQSKSLPVHAVR